MNLETLVKQVEDFFGLKVLLAKENTGKFGLHEKKGIVNFPSNRFYTGVTFISIDGYNWAIERSNFFIAGKLYDDFAKLIDKKQNNLYSCELMLRWFASTECEEACKKYGVVKEDLVGLPSTRVVYILKGNFTTESFGI